MSRRGTTLLELLVVLAIVAVLSLMAVQTLTEFARDAELDSTTHEVASLFETARTKSSAGQIEDGETFESYEPDELPIYGVEIFADGTYELFSLLTRAGESSAERIALESKNTFGETIVMNPPTTAVTFDRISGSTAPTTLTLTHARSTRQTQIDIDKNGSVKITSL